MTERESRPDEPSREGAAGGFEGVYHPFLSSETIRTDENGANYVVRAYEFLVDPQDAGERRDAIGAFVLDALTSGYRPAHGPVVVPNAGDREDGDGGHMPLTALHFFLEKPSP